MMQIAFFKHEATDWEELQHRIQTSDTPRQQLFWMRYLGRIRNHWWKKRGEGARIAVLDTGLDLTHEAFQGRELAGARNFTNRGSETDISDENGHGTHVAGIIAAQRQADETGNQFRGLAYKADLLIGKVLNKHGEGAVDWLAQGINWAVEQGAHVISISVSGTETTHSLYQAVHHALTQGVCIVAAAGNGGSLAQNAIGYPGRYGGVITIAAHDMHGRPSLFSSSGGEIDFMAPGTEIWSTFKNGQYAKLSGTSMATPFVAGLSALIIAAHLGGGPTETPIHNNEDLKEHLLRMATHPGSHDATAGYGALIPFRTVGTSLPLGNLPDLKSTYVYGSEFEPMEEYDDRADLFQVMERKYWINFQISESGKDWRNRFYGEYQDQIHDNAKGVALIVPKESFKSNNVLQQLAEVVRKKDKGRLELKTKPHGKLIQEYLREELPDMIVSPETPFVNQPSAYGFTGFLIADDLLMSCRHGFYPQDKRWKVTDFVAVFGFVMEDETTCCEVFSISQVYEIKEVVAEAPARDRRQDWLIARLDRKVEHPDIQPLTIMEDLEWVDSMPFGTPLYMLGHPFGLPLKFTPDGRVLEKLTDEYYKTSLDSFVGNSGSPVIEVTTQKVVGIFVSGRTGELKANGQSQQIELVYSVGNLMQVANEKIQKISTPIRTLESL